MKSFYIAMLLLLVVITVTAIHISTVNSFQEDGIFILQRLDNAVLQEDFKTAKFELDNFDEFYQAKRRWFSLFLDTADLEQKELHIARIRRFLELGTNALPEFHAEFVQLYDTINALPYREGIHFEVLF